MPPKKTKISEAERAKRIREAASEAETSNDTRDFERAFVAVTSAPKKRIDHPSTREAHEVKK